MIVASPSRPEARSWAGTRLIPVLWAAGMGSAVAIVLRADLATILALLLLVAGASVSLLASRSGDWPVALLGAYVASGFGARALHALSDTSLLHTALPIDREQLADGFVVVAVAVGLGSAAFVFGYSITDSRARIHDRTSEKRARIGLGRMWIVTAAGVACLYMLSRGAGGISAAIESARVVRSESAGNLFWLFGVWVMQVSGLALYVQRKEGGGSAGVLPHFCVFAGGMAGVVTGSRGAAIPLLVAFVVLMLRHNKGGSRLAVIALALGLLVGAVGYGAYKQYSTPGDDWRQSVTVERISAQVNESDYFAIISQRRELMPTGTELTLAVAKSPLYLVPSALYPDKEDPYDFEVRALVLGGKVETGLPISIFGEAWLIGGYGAVVLVLFLLGSGLGLGMRALKTASLWHQVTGAVAIGTTYLLLSRPLVLSVSRLMALLLAIAVAYLIINIRTSRGSEPTR